jgi:hypothetical protein
MKRTTIYAVLHFEGGLKSESTFHLTPEGAQEAINAIRAASPAWGALFAMRHFTPRLFGSGDVTHVTYNPLTDYDYTWPAGMVAHDGSYTMPIPGVGATAEVKP